MALTLAGRSTSLMRLSSSLSARWPAGVMGVFSAMVDLRMIFLQRPDAGGVGLDGGDAVDGRLGGADGGEVGHVARERAAPDRQRIADLLRPRRRVDHEVDGPRQDLVHAV